MGTRYPDQVSADLALYETEVDRLDRNFDPADLSEVEDYEVRQAWDDMSMKSFCKLMESIRREDGEQFWVDFRELLIESRREI